MLWTLLTNAHLDMYGVKEGKTLAWNWWHNKLHEKIILHVVMVRLSSRVNTKIYWQQTAWSGLLFMSPLLMCISITIIIAFSTSWLHVLHPRDKALFIAQCCYFSADSVTYKNSNKSNYILWPLYSFLDPLIRVFSSAMLPMMEWCWT